MRCMIWLLACWALCFPVLAQNTTGCVTGTYCLESSLQVTDYVPCIPTFYCPGNQTAQRCAGGHYCPTVTSQIPCPSGTYCPPASVKPRDCSVFASCPEGSVRYVLWGGIVLMVIMLPLVRLTHYLYKRRNQKLQHQALLLAEQQRSDGPNQSQPMLVKGPIVNIRFRHIRSVIKVRAVETTIMDGVSGEFRSGRLTAIMGPSGAGKTTLINVLTGKAPLTSGEILINGLKDSLKDHRKLVGFVPQHDTMITVLTVRDVLLHSAFTRLPSAWSHEERINKVDDVLQLLGLTAVQHSRIGDELHRGISGGERKRVNIGIELVANPSILFLDEPTTGLDSTISVDVIRLLKDIAKLKVNVVAILHQPRPEIFQMLDDLLLLAPGGKTVYFGAADKTLSYFTTLGYPCPKYMNPADWYIDVISGKCGGPLSPAEVARVVAQQRTSSIKLKHMINKITEEPSDDALYDHEPALAGVQKGPYAIGLIPKDGRGGGVGVMSPSEQPRESLTATDSEQRVSLTDGDLPDHLMFSGADSFKGNEFHPNADQPSSSAVVSPAPAVPRSSLSEVVGKAEAGATVTVIHFPDSQTLESHTPRQTVVGNAPVLNIEEKTTPRSTNGVESPRSPDAHAHFTATHDGIQLAAFNANATGTVGSAAGAAAAAAPAIGIQYTNGVGGGGVGNSGGDMVVTSRRGPRQSDSEEQETKPPSLYVTGSQGEDVAPIEYKPWSTPAVTGYLSEQWHTQEERTFQVSEETKIHAASSHSQNGHTSEHEAAKQMQKYSKQSYPNFFMLVYLHCKRGLLQHLRTLPNVTVELGLHMLCGAVIGMAFAVDNFFIGPLPPFYVPYCPEPLADSCYKMPFRERSTLLGTYVVMALGITAAVVGNRNFGQEIGTFFREASTGVSTLSYATGKFLSDFPLIVLYAFMFTISYATVSAPPSKFSDLFTEILFFEFVMFSVGYFSSVFMESTENAQLLSGTSSLLAGLGTDAESAEKNLCWGRWVTEAIFISEARMDQLNSIVLDPALLAQNPSFALAHPAYIITRYGKDSQNFDMGNWGTDIVVLIIFGLVIRLMTYIALRWRAHKQRV